jgi:outer membrane protein assembly factor BamD (BamD/ComL family)
MKNLILIVLILTFNISTSYAQTAVPTDLGSATITNNYCVTLNTNQELKKFYSISLTELNFTSEAEAKKIFGKISNNYLTYRVDFTHQLVILQVHSNRTKTVQTVTWWNEYLASKCK